MTLRFYNTRTRSKDDFVPLKKDGSVGMYSCGPTVYFHAHLGNMRAYVFADLLKKTLTLAGYDVNHVMNITDVGHLVSDGDEGEDKMEVGKEREGLDAWGCARKFTASFVDFCAKLNIDLPQGEHLCRATDHIDAQIDLVKALEDKGYTYTTDDGIYFDSTKFKSYGDMARLDIEGLEGGKRIADTGKKSNTDFALWKFSPENKQRDMEWDSPWGKGFPGWHIECSAMSMRFLGEQFDIHTGGIDHIPVHHTNEIAQSEAATGASPFVNFWLHNEFLQFDEEVKMSKSSGKIMTVDDLIERGYDPLAFRYLLLTAHYRSPIKFSWDNLDAAQKTLHRLRDKIAGLDESGTANADHVTAEVERIQAPLFDDLNSAAVLAGIHDIMGDDNMPDADKRAILTSLDSVLDIGFFVEAADIPDNIHDLAKARLTARTDKDWAESDRLRDEIAAAGYTVKDTPEGYELKKV